VGVTHVEGGHSVRLSIHEAPEASTDGYDPDVSAERLLALAGLVIAVLLVARLGPPAWRIWRIYSGTRNRRLADAGPLEIPAPPVVGERLADLAALGFSRIGERFIQLPGTPIRYGWLVGEPSGETFVSVVDSPVLGALVACYSSFDDGTWVQTNFPRGSVVTRPDFIAGYVATSVADALVAHRGRVARLAAWLGSPRRVLTMADSLRMDADYRTRHGGITLRPMMIRLVTPALAAVALAIVSALLLLVAR
jgi:hypothetical protein